MAGLKKDGPFYFSKCFLSVSSACVRGTRKQIKPMRVFQPTEVIILYLFFALVCVLMNHTLRLGLCPHEPYSSPWFVSSRTILFALVCVPTNHTYGVSSCLFALVCVLTNHTLRLGLCPHEPHLWCK